MSNVRRIYKYDVSVASAPGWGGASIFAPEGAQIISVAFQDDTLRAWAIVDPEAPETDVPLWLAMTGQRLPENVQPTPLTRLERNGIVIHVFLPQQAHGFQKAERT